jgi:hypothetical protein
MKIIQELNEEVQVITEGKGADKSYFIEGIYLQGGIPNRNKRFYPADMLREKVALYNEQYVNAKRAFGELGHPDGPTINLDRVSHMIVSLKEDGNNFIGRAKVMDTPMGRIVKTFIDEGAKFGVSSRGLGTLKMNSDGINEVQNDFYLATAADIVADPSAPDAFVRGIMEGREWFFDVKKGSWTMQEQEEVKEMIMKAKKQQLAEVKMIALSKFLKSIEGK